MKKFAAICDTSMIFNYPPIISILAALGLNNNGFKTIPLKGNLQLFSGSCQSYVGSKDLIGEMRKDGVKFDSIYIGNLSTMEDVDTVISFINEFKNDDATVVVNPIVEEDAYSHLEKMRELITLAQVITPSYSVTSKFLQHNNSKVTYGDLKTFVKSLSDIGPKVTFITDIPDPNHTEETFVLAYDKNISAYWTIPNCYKKDAKFTFVDVLTELIIKECDLSEVMNSFL